MTDTFTAKDAAGTAVPFLTDTAASINGTPLTPPREVERIRIVGGPDGAPVDVDFAAQLAAIIAWLGAPTWSKQNLSSGTNTLTIAAPADPTQRLRLSNLRLTWTPTLPTNAQILTVYDGPNTSAPVLDRLDVWQAALDYSKPLTASPGNAITINAPAVAGISSRISVVGYTL